MRKIQIFLYIIFEKPYKNKISYFINLFLYSLIALSIFILMLSSVEKYSNNYGSLLTILTNIIMPIFIIEYMLRLYAIGKNKKYAGFSGRLKYIRTPYAIIDLLSIIPYVASGMNLNTSFIRSMRLIRVFRVLRMKKYSSFLSTIKDICFSKKEEFIVLTFAIFIAIIILSFTIFEFEHQAQPQIFDNIFNTMWWAVATLTTVGYGDMYPITTAGKIITSIITILGIAFVAIPGGIFASEFINNISKRKNCPKCNSKDIKKIDNIEIKIQNKIYKYDHMLKCEKCNFKWLENNYKK